VILGLFNQIRGLDEDFARRPETFKRLGERLHPREYNAQFPIAASAFATVRDNKRKPVTFNSTVENALSSGATSAAVALLKNRPGEFARRLDEVLRSANNITQARAFVKAFDAVAAQVSAPVLLQARAALQADRGGNRIFFPKGNVSKFKAIPDTRGDIDLSVRNAAVEACNKGLVARFSERDSLGKVYVDSALDGVNVPLTIRDASKGRVLGRGSRMPFNEKTKVLRFFIWWKDISDDGWTGRVDIDLSAVMLDDNFNTVEAVTYYNLRGLGATHSGDITSAPNGASEFIDIDPAKVLERGARYVAMTVHSYSRQKLSDIPEVFAGYMERNDHESGEIYDPRTVENRVDLTTPTTNSVPYIFDMKTGEAIWIDMAINLGAYGYGGNNAASTSKTTENLVSAVVRKNYPSLGDLFRLHAKARGTLVDSADEADVVFNLDNAFRTEEVLDKYL
jgi:stress response protein SCP2